MTMLKGSTKGRPSASVLIPKTVMTLTLRDQVRMRDILMRQTQAGHQLRALYAELGLDPRKSYRFLDSGEVREIGSYRRLW